MTTGTSMQPFCAGMAVHIVPLSEPPRVGDVLVFKSRNGLAAHRLIRGKLLRRVGPGNRTPSRSQIRT
jgi:hypothetical protein